MARTKTAAKLQISMSFRDSGYERGLRKARTETRETQAAIQKFTPSLKGMSIAAGAAGAALGAVFAGRALLRGAKTAVGLFQAQEDAVEALRASLLATGKDGAGSLKLITDEASRIQSLTKAGDEALIAATATLAQLAPALNAKELASAQASLVGIADTFLKGDIGNAALLVGKSIGSATNALTRYGIQLNTAGTQSEKLAQLVASTGTFFEVSQAKAKTFSGQIEQLKNFFGDMGEIVGEALLPPLREFAVFLVDSRDDIKKFTEAFAKELGKASAAVQTFLRAGTVDFGLAAEQVGVIIGAKLGEGIAKGVLGVVNAVNLTQFLGPIGNLLDKINPAINAFEILEDKARESAQTAQFALNTLAGSSAGGLRELERGRQLLDAYAAGAQQYGTGIGGALAFANTAGEKLLVTSGLLAGAGDTLGKAGATFTAPKPITVGPPVFIPPSTADVDAMLEAFQVRIPLPTFGATPGAFNALDIEAERAAREAAESMTQQFQQFGREATATMQGIGIDLVYGLIDGTLSVGDILKRAVLRLASSFILGPLSGILGIFSPSKVTRGYGKNLGQGLVIGIDGSRAAVRAAAMGLAASATFAIPAPAIGAVDGSTLLRDMEAIRVAAAEPYAAPGPSVGDVDGSALLRDLGRLTVAVRTAVQPFGSFNVPAPTVEPFNGRPLTRALGRLSLDVDAAVARFSSPAIIALKAPELGRGTLLGDLATLRDGVVTSLRRFDLPAAVAAPTLEPGSLLADTERLRRNVARVQFAAPVVPAPIFPPIEDRDAPFRFDPIKAPELESGSLLADLAALRRGVMDELRFPAVTVPAPALEPTVLQKQLAQFAVPSMPAVPPGAQASDQTTRTVIEIKPAEQILRVQLPPMWSDPEGFARTRGAQTFHRTADTEAANSGYRRR